MLQTSFIRQNKEQVLEGLAKRNFKDAEQMIEKVLLLDDTRKATQNTLDNNLAELNSLAKEIGDMFKSGRAGEAAPLKEKTAVLKSQSKELEERLSATEKELQDLLYLIPNVAL